MVDYNFEELRTDNEFRIAFTTIIRSKRVYRDRARGAKRMAEILLPVLKDYRAGKEIGEVQLDDF